MKILALSPFYPDAPSDGDRLRLYHWLGELGRKHELHLLCFADPSRPEDWAEGGLGKAVRSVRRVSRSGWQRWMNAGLRAWAALPANVNAYASAEMRAAVDEAAGEGFDAVFAYRLRMAPYALRFRGPRFLDYCDSMTRYAERLAAASDGWRRKVWQGQAAKLAAYEAYCSGQFDAGFFNATGDRDAVLSMAPGSPLKVAANGVDERLLKARRRPGGGRLLFVGQLGYAPNADAVGFFGREVFPRIRRARPDAVFEVVGPGAGPSLAGLKGQPGIEFSGFLPDTLAALERASVVVCPVRQGAGRQNKLLEAFAAGVPAVSSSLAAEGAEAVHGRHLLVADPAEETAQACLRLMKDRALGARLADNGRRLVKEKYSWVKNSLVLDQALKSQRTW